LIHKTRTMITIAEGVEFDTIAREWRCKFSTDNDKASLVAAQKAIQEVLAEVKAVDGVKSVQRVVCGGCLDFKVKLIYAKVHFLIKMTARQSASRHLSCLLFFLLLRQKLDKNSISSLATWKPKKDNRCTRG